MPSVEQYRHRVNKRLAELELAKRQFRVESEATAIARAAEQDVLEAQKVAQIIIQGLQERAHARISGVVTRCLEAVFDDPYEFCIVFEQKRGHTEARLVFVRDGQELDPMSASGGGVIDVASFALRLSCLMLSKPPLRRFLCLDEPFKFVSEEYRERVRVLLETLPKELGVQIIMITHITEFQIGKVIEL